MFKGIKNLYVVNGKLVFRAHFKEKEQENIYRKPLVNQMILPQRNLEK